MYEGSNQFAGVKKKCVGALKIKQIVRDGLHKRQTNYVREMLRYRDGTVQ